MALAHVRVPWTQDENDGHSLQLFLTQAKRLPVHGMTFSLGHYGATELLGQNKRRAGIVIPGKTVVKSVWRSVPSVADPALHSNCSSISTHGSTFAL